MIKIGIVEVETLTKEGLTIICLNCHAPQIKDASPELVTQIAGLVMTALEEKGEAEREAAKKELSKLNINCLVCHNLKSTGFDVQPKEGVIYGPRDVEDSPHEELGLDTIKSDYMKTSNFCAQCHHCPPSIPWKDCPTLYTTYIEDFIHKGRKETCQDCHMKGEDPESHESHELRSHKFPGPNNLDFLKTAVSLTVNARITKYMDIYELKRIPAVVAKIDLTNNAGHTIPHG